MASVLLSAAVCYVIYRLAFTFPALTEHLYSRRIYPFLARNLGRLTGSFSFSLAEVLLYLFAAGVLFFLGYIFCAFFKPKGSKFYHIAKRFLSFLILLCTLYNMFILFWGLNYARQPLADSMHLEIQEYSKEELVALCDSLIERTNATPVGASATGT